MTTHMTRDTDTNKRVGWWLLTLAGILTIAAVLLWQQADQDAERERVTAAYEAAITGGEPADGPAPNRTPALITLGAAGIAVICATVLLTRPTWPGRHPASGREDPEQQGAEPEAEAERGDSVPTCGEVEGRDGQMTTHDGATRSVARLYVHELTWARMAPTWRLRVLEWRHRRRRSIPDPAEFAAWAAIRRALTERGVRLPEP